MSISNVSLSYPYFSNSSTNGNVIQWTQQPKWRAPTPLWKYMCGMNVNISLINLYILRDRNKITSIQVSFIKCYCQFRPFRYKHLFYILQIQEKLNRFSATYTFESMCSNFVPLLTMTTCFMPSMTNYYAMSLCLLFSVFSESTFTLLLLLLLSTLLLSLLLLLLLLSLILLLILLLFSSPCCLVPFHLCKSSLTSRYLFPLFLMWLEY